MQGQKRSYLDELLTEQSASAPDSVRLYDIRRRPSGADVMGDTDCTECYIRSRCRIRAMMISSAAALKAAAVQQDLRR
jgi:hypothetical protein